MKENKRGILFVFSGPSGVGKGTLNKLLFAEFSNEIAFSVSATTRSPREGEINGKDYFFIDRQEFECRVANNDFLEHAEFAGNCYGTPRRYVEDLLASGMNVLLEIDVQGALQVMHSMPECVSIFILPPSYDELEKRLRGRGTETEDKISKRLHAARQEIEKSNEYRYRIINGDSIEDAYAELKQIYLYETKNVPND